MKKTKVSIIVAIIGTAGTIIGSFIAISAKQELASQNQYIQSNIVSVNGSENAVTINNVDDLIENYNMLVSENETLKQQNSQYFSDYSAVKAENDYLKSQFDNVPTLSYENLSLCVDGNDIPINTNNSKVIIDGRTYFSEDFLINTLNESLTIKDGVAHIGVVTTEKTYLSKQYIIDSLRCNIENSAIDTYGTMHTDCIVFLSGLYSSSEIMFNAENKYSMLKGTLSAKDGQPDDHTTFTIKADDEVVYTTELTKTTKPIEINVPINNCSVLTFTKEGDPYFNCILSKAILYN